MARGVRSFLCLLAIFAFCVLGRTQKLPTPVASGGREVHIQLGQSAVPLNGPWKFAVGDSPIAPKTGKPLWAEPGFDDSRWETVDLTPQNGAIHFISGQAGYVPGWTAKGHAGYWGYAWYRLQLHMETSPDQALALAGPPDVDDVYQVFADGTQIGALGNFTSATPVDYYSVPMMFELPRPAAGKLGSTTQTLAFRVWMPPNALALDPAAGGLHDAPLLGTTAAVTAAYQLRWLELVRSYAGWVFEALLFALLAALSFSLILFDRSDRVYLWMGGLFVLEAVFYAQGVFSAWTQHLSIFTDSILAVGIETPLLNAGWLMVWWLWFGRPQPLWLPRAAVALAVLDSITSIVGTNLLFTFVSPLVAVAAHRAAIVVELLWVLAMAWLVIQGIRRQGREGWLVLPAVVLWGMGAFSHAFLFLNVQMYWHPFGVSIGPGQISEAMLALALAVLLLRRLLRSVAAQRLLALDVKQAQEVQQVILPEAQVVHPGFTIESVYRPAREVGGDFFQIIPHTSDGSLLIVAGDVAGKGLKAGMLVALLVGAIRTLARFSPDPVTVLGELNQRLLGRGDAAATCLAMRIAADGSVTLANAGHLPPYLNGEPVAMEGALPLGMIEGAECSVMRFALQEKDKLVLISDGIIEAMDADGRLFGFERMGELLGSTVSATEVADAAERFGQEDDISVISVTRTPVLEPALA